MDLLVLYFFAAIGALLAFWPMTTAGPEGGKRGACSECRRSETVDEELTSVTMPGLMTGVAVCSQCVTLTKYAKHLK